MAKQPTPISPTKKHLARMEKERIQRRYLIIGTIVVVVLVLGVVFYGLLDQLVLQRAKPVAQVGSEVITTQSFQTQVRYLRYRLIEQLSYFASDPMT